MRPLRTLRNGIARLWSANGENLEGQGQCSAWGAMAKRTTRRDRTNSYAVRSFGIEFQTATAAWSKAASAVAGQRRLKDAGGGDRPHQRSRAQPLRIALACCCSG